MSMTFQSVSDFLGRQSVLMHDPAYELRSKCLLPLQIALDTKRSKFVALSLSGLHVRNPFTLHTISYSSCHIFLIFVISCF